MNGLLVKPDAKEQIVEQLLETLGAGSQYRYLRETARASTLMNYGFEACLPDLAQFLLAEVRAMIKSQNTPVSHVVATVTSASCTAVIGIGNSLDNVITGTSGNNQLSGGLGNDSINAGAGNDTYAFGLGGGTDTVSDSGGTADKVLFDSSVDKSVLAFYMSGNDLQFGYVGTSDMGTVQNQSVSGNTVERFELNDGQYLTDSDINTVIQQMAAYAASNSIPFASLGDVKNSPELMNIIVSSWHPA